MEEAFQKVNGSVFLMVCKLAQPNNNPEPMTSQMNRMTLF